MVLEFLCGCGPAHDRLSAWLSRHPGAAAAAMLLGALACATADGWL